jgi:hypothetical protein
MKKFITGLLKAFKSKKPERCNYNIIDYDASTGLTLIRFIETGEEVWV